MKASFFVGKLSFWACLFPLLLAFTVAIRASDPVISLLPASTNPDGSLRLSARVSGVDHSAQKGLRSLHIDGLLLWLAADDLDGDFRADPEEVKGEPKRPIAFWRDRAQGLYGIHLFPGQAPLRKESGLPGLPLIEFGARNQLWLEKDVPGETVFIVHSYRAPRGGRDQILGSGLQLVNRAKRWQLSQEGRFTINSGKASNQLSINCLQVSAGNQALFVDGILAGRASRSGVVEPFQGLGHGFHGDLAEVLIFERWLGREERQRVEGYLAHKWKLSELLSGSHPFRKIPPKFSRSLDVSFHWGTTDGGKGRTEWQHSETCNVSSDGLCFFDITPPPDAGDVFFKASATDGTKLHWSGGNSVRSTKSMDTTVKASTRGRKPNVIFILTDDQGYGDLASHAHPYIQTPNLDRLASQGTRFQQCYTASPVCSPSRVAFLTGRTPSSLGVHTTISNTASRNKLYRSANFLPPDIPNVARTFRDGGYRTAHFGKWHMGGNAKLKAPDPLEYGYDRALTTLSTGTQLTESAYFKQATKEEQAHFRAKSTDIMVSESLDFLRKYRDDPVFIQFWTLVPHAPLLPTTRELEAYRDLRVDPGHFTGPFSPYLAKAPAIDEQMKTYLAAITGMDRALGRLLEGIRKLGLEEDTLIVFASDNGPESYSVGHAKNAGTGSPAWFSGRKRSLHEGGVRTPLIVKWPGRVPANRVNTRSVIFACDLYPTLCSLAGLPLPAGFAGDGEDMSDVFLGAKRDRVTPVVLSFPPASSIGEAYAIRQGDWKLLVGEKIGVGIFQLYNLRSDPGETWNQLDGNLNVAIDLYSRLLLWQMGWSSDPHAKPRKSQ